jgi:tRNA G18 (ribose-2'-O)-methylase SpoU
VLTPCTDITTPDDPRLADYANLKDEQLRRDEFLGRANVFVAESELVVRALLASRFATRSILITRDAWAKLGPDLTTLVGAREIPAYVVQGEMLHDVVGFPFHRGLLAAASRDQPHELPQVLTTCTALLILENVVNHDNVGAIFRNVSALGGERPGLILSSDCCDPLYRKALRVSIGHVLDVPWVKLPDARAWPMMLEAAKAAGWTLVALTPGEGSEPIAQVPPQARVRPALLLGAEGPGLTRGTLSRADRLVRIPMRWGVDSLNVATAGAVALSWLVGGPVGGDGGG